MSVNSFTILGSSAGVPQAERATTSHVLKVGESLNIIDCGGSFCQRFLQLGFDPLRIDRVFITHTHPDHVAELPLCIQMIKLLKREKPVEFYFPEEFVEPFMNYLPSMYLFPHRFPFEMKVIGYSDGFVYDGPFYLKAIANPHLEDSLEKVAGQGYTNRAQAHSFDILVGDTSLFHSADIHSYHDIKPYVDGHDYVILESAHIDLDAVFEHVLSANVGQFVISHIVSDEKAVEIQQKVQEQGIDNLVIASDGIELEL